MSFTWFQTFCFQVICFLTFGNRSLVTYDTWLHLGYDMWFQMTCDSKWRQTLDSKTFDDRHAITGHGITNQFQTPDSKTEDSKTWDDKPFSGHLIPRHVITKLFPDTWFQSGIRCPEMILEFHVLESRVRNMLGNHGSWNYMSWNQVSGIGVVSTHPELHICNQSSWNQVSGNKCQM